MKTRQLMGLAIANALLGLLTSAVLVADESREAEVSPQVDSASEPIENRSISIEVARDRATLSQDIYVATLRMLHERYFHRDKKVLPARAMHDVFADIEAQSKVNARWISASLKPMSVDHSPENDFEKKAAKEIAAGTEHLETIEDEYYRRAVAIPLTGGCLGCHEGVFQSNGRKKFAGLVVSIPLGRESTDSTARNTASQ